MVMGEKSLEVFFSFFRAFIKNPIPPPRAFCFFST